MEARRGPRDPRGQSGAYEAALADRHRLVLPKQPLEIERTIHSFDPCVACAVHVAEPEEAVGGDEGELRLATAEALTAAPTDRRTPEIRFIAVLAPV